MNFKDLGVAALCVAVGITLIILALHGDWLGLMVVLLLTLSYVD